MIDVQLVGPNEWDIEIGVPPDRRLLRAVCSTHRRWVEAPLSMAMVEDVPFLESVMWPGLAQALRIFGCDCPDTVSPDFHSLQLL